MTKTRLGNLLMVIGGSIFLLLLAIQLFFGENVRGFIFVLLLCPSPLLIIGAILLLGGKRKSLDALKKEPQLAQGAVPKAVEQQPIADYRLVKGQNGNITGVWLRDPTFMKDGGVKLLFLLIKEGLSKDVQAAVAMGYYRILPNSLDNTGGSIVMWDVMPVPGTQPPMPPISLFGDAVAKADTQQSVKSKPSQSVKKPSVKKPKAK